jgi:hypothetical protein
MGTGTGMPKALVVKRRAGSVRRSGPVVKRLAAWVERSGPSVERAASPGVSGDGACWGRSSGSRLGAWSGPSRSTCSRASRVLSAQARIFPRAAATCASSNSTLSSIARGAVSRALTMMATRVWAYSSKRAMGGRFRCRIWRSTIAVRVFSAVRATCLSLRTSEIAEGSAALSTAASSLPSSMRWVMSWVGSALRARTRLVAAAPARPALRFCSRCAAEVGTPERPLTPAMRHHGRQTRPCQLRGH